jgi:hypothetical protein
VFAKVGEIEEVIDGSQKVILGDGVFEIIMRRTACLEACRCCPSSDIAPAINTRVLSHQSIFEPSFSTK